jgi:hypothetical protein
VQYKEKLQSKETVQMKGTVQQKPNGVVQDKVNPPTK